MWLEFQRGRHGQVRVCWQQWVGAAAGRRQAEAAATV